MNKVYAAKNIVNAHSATELVGKSCYVTSIVINCTVAGQTLTIQDRGSSSPTIPIKALIGPITLGAPGPGPDLLAGKFELLNDAVLMLGGVDAVTTGTGTCTVWVCAFRSEQEI